MSAANWIRQAPSNWEEMQAFAAFHEASKQLVEWGQESEKSNDHTVIPIPASTTTSSASPTSTSIPLTCEGKIKLLAKVMRTGGLGDAWVRTQYLFALVVTGKIPREINGDPFTQKLLEAEKSITFTKEEVLKHAEQKAESTYINWWPRRQILKVNIWGFQPGRYLRSRTYFQHQGREEGQAELIRTLFEKSCTILTQLLISRPISTSTVSPTITPSISSLQNDIRMLDNHIAYLSKSLEQEKEETDIQLGAGASSSILRLEKALKKALKERDDAIFKLTREKTTALGRISEIETERDRVIEERDTALARIKDLETVGPNYNPDPALATLAARITVVETERDEAIASLAQVRLEKTTVENERDAAIEKATQAETAKDQAIVARDEAIAGKNKAEAERDEANRTVTELRGRVKVLETSETTLKERVSTLESSKASQQTDIDALKLQVKELQEIKESLTSIKARKKELKIKLEKAVEMLQSLKADLEDIISSTTNSKSEASSSAPSSNQPSDELPEVNSLLLLLKSKFEEKNNEISQLKTSISKLQKLGSVQEMRLKLKFDLNKFLNEKIQELDFAKALIEKVTTACEIRDFSKIELFDYISSLVTDYKAIKASCEAKQTDKSISTKLNGNIMALEAIQKTLQPKK